ncbi:MAG TPA: arsenite methyltransferase [Holophaga sp.]|nr:arsenite methyltransferase [Holophaga sp.]
MTDDTLKAALRERYAGFVNRNESCCGPRSCGCAGDASLALGYDPGDLEAAPEGANLGLGCGNPVALASLEPGQVVLDLGSGAGFDAFLASRKVGPGGRVIGVDMTPAMLERARGLAARHGYANVEFREGDIEALPVEDAAVDVVISNCVLNLAPDKGRAFREAFRALRPGGRLMVSDLVLLRPLPPELARDLDAVAACVGGALPKEDYLAAIRGAGFEGVEIVGESAFDLGEPGLMEVAGDLTGGRIPAPELLEASRAVASIQVRAVKP